MVIPVLKKPSPKPPIPPLKNLSFIEKYEQVEILRELAWKLKAARIRSQHPNWSENEVENAVKKIFLYANT